MNIEMKIAAMAYHVMDGNAPEELPEILAELLERLKQLETINRADRDAKVYLPDRR